MEVNGLEGLFIYWFGWWMWIIISFFWEKTKRRLCCAIAILVFLSLLPYKIEFSTISISIVFLALSFYLCWCIRRYSNLKLLYFLFASWTIGAAYSAFHLVLIIDPVIQLFDARWMSACIVSVLAFILGTQLRNRFVLVLFGLVQGDYVLSLAIKRLLHLQHEIGSLSFFDTISIVALFFGLVWLMHHVSHWISKAMPNRDTTSLKQSS